MSAKVAAKTLDDTFIKIGVQIRTGDGSFMHPNSADSGTKHQPWWKKQQNNLLHMRHNLSAPGISRMLQKAWILPDMLCCFSDLTLYTSETLLRSAVLVHGSKVLTTLDKSDTLKYVSSTYGSGGPEIMKHTAGEHWL